MNKKISISLLVVAIILVVVLVVKSQKEELQKEELQNSATVAVSAPTVDNKVSAVKEFTMTSFTEVVEGKYKPQFSLKEITVNKGDKVRIKITVTSGMHDFKIDEYGVYADTKLNEEMVVEFTADKAGDFIYYCAKPGHRQNGHWGTLKVLDLAS